MYMASRHYNAAWVWHLRDALECGMIIPSRRASSVRRAARIRDGAALRHVYGIPSSHRKCGVRMASQTCTSAEHRAALARENRTRHAAIADLNGEALDGSRLRVERLHAWALAAPRSAAAERAARRPLVLTIGTRALARDRTAEEKIADKCWNCGQTGHRRNDCSNEPLPRAEQEKIRDAYSRARGARDGRDRDRDRERDRDDYVDRRRDDHGNGGARRGGRDRDENDDYRGPRPRAEVVEVTATGSTTDARLPRSTAAALVTMMTVAVGAVITEIGHRTAAAAATFDRRRRDDYGDRRGGRDDRGGRRGDDRDFDRKRQFGGRDRGDDDFEKRPRHNDRGDDGRNGAADVAPPPLSGEDLEKLAAENAKKVQNAEAVQSDW
ncbi:hypothetical protein FVE85_8192 [Porphyridium purpureum]|uniref:CCHC-type domain-containing protein n=1 Tax=Porphyridium purpureum TaxID=35688 RepID=A0A5J4YNB8_PORPP|nr:hypothetical protein FVE85_8192 [Porphyridium purpureum]|eukprot:POR1717..scf295_9